MALTLTETPQNPNPDPNPNRNHFVGENYELSLNQLMQEVLDLNGCDSSSLAATSYQLMQARADPPLETIWVYSALTFRNSNSAKDDYLDRVSAMKDLFKLISGCSASCSSSKSIALLASVIYEVHSVLVDSRGKDLGFKGEKKLMREIKSLVNSVLGFISLCCSANEIGDGLDSEGLVRPLDDLARLWVTEHQIDKTSESFKLFFPLLCEEIVQWLTVEGNGVSELAGVVILETFLLRLCLGFQTGVSKIELQRELRTWAIGSITGFRHFHFFEALVRTLLERTLPVTSLLSYEDEIYLKKILYDAVILVDYSFLSPDKMVDLPAKRIKGLAIARVLVSHEATELFRREGDQTKAISYINAFSGSQLPSQLVKLVIGDIGMGSKAGQPKGSSPKALLKWILDFEDRGVKLLDDGLVKCLSRLALDFSEAEYGTITNDREGKNSDADLLFYIDNKGEGDGSEEDEKTKESMSAVFLAAAHAMSSAESGSGRKRKVGRDAEKKKRIKFLKYNLQEDFGSSGEKSAFVEKDGSNSGSEVEDPFSDEDVEETEK
ncbi:hypothetical protein NMG60_11021966 [Bertholletia excelsa]